MPRGIPNSNRAPISLAVMLDPAKRSIVISPVDVSTQFWLERGGDSFLRAPLQQLHGCYQSSAVSRRDLPIIAAHLLAIVNAAKHVSGWCTLPSLDDVDFRVRAYEYRTVVKEEELVEIR